MKPLVLYKSDGTRQTPTDDGVYTLANSTVYYAELFSDIEDAADFSFHVEWSAALVASITTEATGFPKEKASSYASSKWRATGATTISAASSASGAVFHGADFIAPRVRIKFDVTTGGTVQGYEHAKKRGLK